jgi:hypothetical protein
MYRLDDIKHEHRIDDAQRQFEKAKPADRRAAWDRLRALINARSPEMVAELEQRKGLR